MEILKCESSQDLSVFPEVTFVIFWLLVLVRKSPFRNGSFGTEGLDQRTGERVLHVKVLDLIPNTTGLSLNTNWCGSPTTHTQPKKKGEMSLAQFFIPQCVEKSLFADIKIFLKFSLFQKSCVHIVSG